MSRLMCYPAKIIRKVGRSSYGCRILTISRFNSLGDAVETSRSVMHLQHVKVLTVQIMQWYVYA